MGRCNARTALAPRFPAAVTRLTAIGVSAACELCAVYRAAGNRPLLLGHRGAARTAPGCASPVPCRPLGAVLLGPFFLSRGQAVRGCPLPGGCVSQRARRRASAELPSGGGGGAAMSGSAGSSRAGPRRHVRLGRSQAARLPPRQRLATWPSFPRAGSRRGSPSTWGR